MKAYIIRRLLLMIPTFFGISLIVFAVLNLAPGRPGAQRADIALDPSAEQSQESYRIFREQFNLDKPVLFNTRFLLEQADVDRMLERAAGVKEATTAERIRAQEELEDLGEHAVPHLVAILNETTRSGKSELRD